MKTLIASLFLCAPLLSYAACIPIEWGGSGTSYTVGTTTSGTWYVWNCFEDGKLVPKGRVIVSGHRPSATCLAAIINPFIAVDEKCNSINEDEIIRYTRLQKSAKTAQAKLPK
jgi:hypothetical protein